MISQLIAVLIPNSFGIDYFWDIRGFGIIGLFQYLANPLAIQQLVISLFLYYCFAI